VPIGISKIESITILPVDLFEEYLIIGPTIPSESITGKRISEESHPDIDILRRRSNALDRDATFFCEIDMVPSLLLHLSPDLILGWCEIDDTIVRSEELLVHAIPTSLQEEHEEIAFLVYSESRLDHPTLFYWFNLEEYNSLRPKRILEGGYTLRKI
jgi:hypothetical protein